MSSRRLILRFLALLVIVVRGGFLLDIDESSSLIFAAILFSFSSFVPVLILSVRDVYIDDVLLFSSHIGFLLIVLDLLALVDFVVITLDPASLLVEPVLSIDLLILLEGASFGSVGNFEMAFLPILDEVPALDDDAEYPRGVAILLDISVEELAFGDFLLNRDAFVAVVRFRRTD